MKWIKLIHNSIEKNIFLDCTPINLDKNNLNRVKYILKLIFYNHVLIYFREKKKELLIFCCNTLSYLDRVILAITNVKGLQNFTLILECLFDYNYLSNAV